jgi:hypothetical protein
MYPFTNLIYDVISEFVECRLMMGLGFFSFLGRLSELVDHAVLSRMAAGLSGGGPGIEPPSSSFLPPGDDRTGIFFLKTFP